MMKKIVCFGNPVYDIISTPFLRSSDRILSGCSTNASLALSKLGVSSTLVGCVGEDYYNKLNQDLAYRGIDSVLYPSETTGGFSLIYDDFGNRELSVLGIARSLPNSMNGMPEPNLIILGPILGEVSVSLVLDLVSRFRSVPILLDPQGLLRVVDNGQVLHKHTKEFDDIAKLSTIIKANELETEIVTGINPRKKPVEAVKALYEFGGKYAIVTLAEAGSIIYDGMKLLEIPPFSTKAIDPTGAGDTYAAGFSCKFLEDKYDLITAGCFASSVSSIMVENSGPDFHLTHDDAIERMEKLKCGSLSLRL
jgi:sugar/nucleoside kinase (ribokinase family)